MAHLFICPKCTLRSQLSHRKEGLKGRPPSCRKCGFPILFELLDDYYPAPNAAFFVLDQQGRVIACGKGAFELTGLSEERAIGRPASEVLGLEFSDDSDQVQTALEWGVRSLDKAVHVRAEGDIPVTCKADMFPAYDDDGGLLLVLTRSVS